MRRRRFLALFLITFAFPLLGAEGKCDLTPPGGGSGPRNACYPYRSKPPLVGMPWYLYMCTAPVILSSGGVSPTSEAIVWLTAQTKGLAEDQAKEFFFNNNVRHGTITCAESGPAPAPPDCEGGKGGIGGDWDPKPVPPEGAGGSGGNGGGDGSESSGNDV
jgi:hypothetical protein